MEKARAPLDSKNSKRILLVDDEVSTVRALTRTLERNGFAVSTASNGKLAEEMVAIERFDAVLSDIHMPGSHVSGIELFEYVKALPRPIPVILMTGFATLTETKNAHERGVNAFLAKPFSTDDLLKVIRPACGLSAETPVQEENVDHLYSKLSIDDFVSGKEIQYTIFVRLSPSKYVKISHSGEDLSMERIRSYKEKGIRHLYLLKDDFNKYLMFNLELLKAVKKVASIEPAKKANLVKHAAEIVLEQIYTDRIEKEMLENTRSVMDNTVSMLSESRETFDLLSALSSHSDFLYAHSIGVSFFAVLIARQLGWNSPATLYKASISGILHDIGKKEIDRSILSKPRNAMTVEEVQMLETHPTRGVEILSRVEGVSHDVIQIIAQHHERGQGSGYPHKLPKVKVHPIARLIAVADEFCKMVIKNPDGAAIDPVVAVQKLITIHGDSLDMSFVDALAQVLKVGVPASALADAGKAMASNPSLGAIKPAS